MFGNSRGIQNRETTHPLREKPEGVVQASGQDASWTSPCGGVTGKFNQETLGRHKTCWRASMLVWKDLRIHLVQVASERDVSASFIRLLPPQAKSQKSGEVNGWMDGWMVSQFLSLVTVHMSYSWQ